MHHFIGVFNSLLDVHSDIFKVCIAACFISISVCVGREIELMVTVGVCAFQSLKSDAITAND